MSLVTEIPRNIVFFSSRTVQKHLKLFIGIVLYRRIECKPVTLGNSGKQRSVPAFLLQRLEAVDGDRTFGKRQRTIRNHPFNRNAAGDSKPGAVRAGSGGIVKGKHPRLKVTKGNSVLLAGVSLRKLHLARLFAVISRHGDHQ